MEPSSYPRPILDNIKDRHSKIPTLFSLSMPVLCVFLQILACFCEILNIFLYEFRKKMIKSFQKQLPSILKMLFPFKTTMNGQLGTFEVISLSFIIFIFVLVNLSMLIIISLNSEKNSFITKKLLVTLKLSNLTKY